MNSHIRAVCDDFARQGYLTVAPALFDRVERDVELGYAARTSPAAGSCGSRPRSRTCSPTWRRGPLRSPGAGKIGVVGYCWGGTVAWVGATRSKSFSAAVGYYGGVTGRAEERPHCPVQLHFGEPDPSIPIADVRKMKAAHPDIPVFIYPAGHGFTCDQRGALYHAESARLARERTLAFFGEHVG